ncbi:DUF4238 domain-containing protein [Aromatoleum aromaticum]|uniref:DUF4238 domain-containing protein n=1 Tax=Aromatoleum aromaticum TaxID=551760 RepID=UPI0020407F52|nr:DUF4238 domain-containing protein [Aromatoleum aromaticum]
MLFDPSRPSIVIAGDKGVSGTLTRNQKTFNRLIKQIEQKRQRLAAWEILLPRYQKKYAEELLPIEAELESLQSQMVRKLDRAYGEKGLTRAERKVLAEFIANLAAPLLEKSDDPELKEIYNRHSGSDYDEDLAAEKQQIKEMFEDMMGVGLDDDIDFSDPESLLRQVQEKMTEQAEKARAEQASRAARRKRRSNWHANRRRKPRKRRSAPRFATFTASSPARCTPIVSRTWPSASARTCSCSASTALMKIGICCSSSNCSWNWSTSTRPTWPR